MFRREVADEAIQRKDIAPRWIGSGEASPPRLPGKSTVRPATLAKRLQVRMMVVVDVFMGSLR